MNVQALYNAVSTSVLEDFGAKALRPLHSFFRNTAPETVDSLRVLVGDQYFGELCEAIEIARARDVGVKPSDRAYAKSLVKHQLDCHPLGGFLAGTRRNFDHEYDN